VLVTLASRLGIDRRFGERLFNLQRQARRSLDVGYPDSPGPVRGLLEDDGTSFGYRLAIPIAVVAVEAQGGHGVLVGNVKDDLDRPEWNDCERLALVRRLNLPDTFEPGEGRPELSDSDVKMVAFQSLPPLG